MLGTTEGKKLTKYVSDYVIFDLETTGFSSEYDQITEISGVKVLGGQIVDEFSSLVNPGRPIPWQVTNVTGITDDMVWDKPGIDVVLEKFLDFVGNLTLVGHNINTFDMKFIYRDCLKYWGQIPDNDYIDTLRMAKILLPDLKHRKLVDLAEYYGISSVGAHRALNDCRMNQAVFEMLGKEIGSSSETDKGVPKKAVAITKKRVVANKISDETKASDVDQVIPVTGRSEAQKAALIDDLFGTNRSQGIRNPGEKTPKKNITELLGVKDEEDKKSDASICPKCGNLLQKRNGRFGEFLGCTGYPNCRFTMNV